MAAPVDTIGGADAGAQTLHHCGYLRAHSTDYTSSRATILTVEDLLIRQGYGASRNGVYGKDDIAAVKRFQADRGLKVDGIVGPETGPMLGYYSHPDRGVRSCFRPAFPR